MGNMIECRSCKTPLPGESRYCYLCGNAVTANLAVDVPEHLSENDIPTSLSTHPVLTDVHQSPTSPAIIDPYSTALDLKSGEESLPVSSPSNTLPFADLATQVPDQGEEDPGNAITDPSMRAVFAGVRTRQVDDEVPIGYAMPSGLPSYEPMSPPSMMSQNSGRPPLSRIITVISTILILVGAVIGLVLTGLPRSRAATPPSLTVLGKASPDSALTIHGSYFVPGGSVTVLVDDSPIASSLHQTQARAEIQMAAVGLARRQALEESAATVVNGDGSFDKAYIVPKSWQPGSSHMIRATEKGTNGDSITAQLLVKTDAPIQTPVQKTAPAVNPQVTVMPVSTVIPAIPTYPGPPVQPTPPPKKKVPTPHPTKAPMPTPHPTKAPTPTATPVVPTPTSIPPTSTPVPPTQEPPTQEPPTPVPPTQEPPTPVPPTPVLPTPIPSVVVPLPSVPVLETPTITPTSTHKHKRQHGG